jgi:hypothetical protein
MSVQVHAELVQVLAGNAVVAKTPSQSGFHCLTFAHAFMARAGLPVTLLSGVGGKLGDVLISNPRIGTLAFVRGRSNARKAVELGEQFEEAMQGRGFPCTAARWCAGVFLMAGHLGIRRTPCVFEPPVPGRCTTPSRSAPSTPSSAWTPRPSCSRP